MPDWDKRYRESASRPFGAEPNEYLREIMARSDVRPGSALVLGDGDGRNGAWLASRGLAVTAVDISGVASDQAAAFDAENGVAVERITADLADWTPPAGRTWDAALMFFLQCEERVRHESAARAAAALSPGGWFAAEGFSVAGEAAEGLGPKLARLLYDLESLIAALPGFEVVEAFDGMTRLDEGERHKGAAKVVRLLARKPA